MFIYFKPNKLLMYGKSNATSTCMKKSFMACTKSNSSILMKYSSTVISSQAWFAATDSNASWEGDRPLYPLGLKTPKTVLEAESQPEYLESRVRRHHSSSQKSILEALKSSSKGTKVVMPKLTLVGAETQDRRQANEIRNLRRRAKRTRLQKRGVITAEKEGQAID